MARKVQINKGVIQGNALAALVKSNLFRHKIMKPKKGKGSYTRKGRQEVCLCFAHFLMSCISRYFQVQLILIQWKTIPTNLVLGVKHGYP